MNFLKNFGTYLVLAKEGYDIYSEMQKDGTIQKIMDAVAALLSELHSTKVMELLGRFKAVAAPAVPAPAEPAPPAAPAA